MEITKLPPKATNFEDLMWNDAFALTPELDTIFIRIQDIYGKATPTPQINAVQLGIKDNSKEPTRLFDKDTPVYKVYITSITVAPE